MPPLTLECPVHVLRSARLPALLLLLAAIAGLVVAATPAGPGVIAARDAHLAVAGIDLSVGHWITDGLLALFFFVVAVELRHELTVGSLRSPRAVLVPAIAALGGVVVPIALYLVIANGTPSASGWPIPTATDIAFALGVLAVVGRGLPSGVRVFLLALAILDDIVGIVLIAVVFTADIDFVALAAALALTVAFGALSLLLRGRARVPVAVLMVVVAITVWVLVHESGVHATIAGVLLGLAIAPGAGARARHALEPWVNVIVLPLFAFASALMPIPQVSPAAFAPAFWGTVLALPVGKFVGVIAFGSLAMALFSRGSRPLAFGDLAAAGALSGIGFTVSLLMSELAFAGAADLRDQAILGVLGGSAISLLAAVVLVSLRARRYRRVREAAA